MRPSQQGWKPRQFNSLIMKMVVTPAVMSSLETVPPTKRQEAELEREGSNGDVLWKDGGCIGQSMLNVQLPGTRKRGSPPRRFMDVVKEGKQSVGVSQEDVRGRVKWRQMI